LVLKVVTFVGVVEGDEEVEKFGGGGGGGY
jgi:hypothetical protein